MGLTDEFINLLGTQYLRKWWYWFGIK
jgi:hypothetical protein